MNDLVERIAQAIVRQEAMPADHINPGNLRDCPWFAGQAPLLAQEQDDPTHRIVSRRKLPDGSPVQYRLGASGIFWVPATRTEGEAAIRHCLWLRTVERQSLRVALYAWAPPTDGNETEVYIRNVKEWAAIADENVPLLSLLEDTPAT